MKTLLSLVLACAAMSCNAAEWVRARVVDAPQSGQITLQHEAIKSLGMGPMTMPFQVDERVSLKGFKVGDKVRFRAHADGNFIVIDALVHTP